MAQIFHPSSNSFARASIIGSVLLLAGLGLVATEVERSPYVTDAGVFRTQPVPFSHEHHVRGLGIDCRYCHTSVQDSSFAGIPPTKTCMSCHTQIWTNAAMLEPVRWSWETARPIAWTRVNNLPDFVYFNHDIHVAKGVGCSTCHGQVEQMPLIMQAATLQMEWCLNCHREPRRFLRPREEVFNMEWRSPPDQLERGEKLAKLYHVHNSQLMQNCSLCHR